MATPHAADEADIRQRIDVFAAYQAPLGYEIRDLTITVGDDMAFAHSLNRISGTLKIGVATDYCVRWTPCFRKIDGSRLIVHGQVSVPIDEQSRSALMDLEL